MVSARKYAIKPLASWLAAARQLVDRIDHGNHYEMLESLLSALEQRNKTAIAHTNWERREAHQYATPKIEQLAAALGEPGIAREIVVAEKKTLYGQIGSSRIS